MSVSYSKTSRPLTPRMREVVASAAAGRTAVQTALELGVSEETVKSIRAALCSRLGAPNITAAAVTALRKGLIA